jgi:ketosteroid isomerase-like protein
MLGTAFADALARNDYSELGALLHPEIEFRALTPRRTWEPERRNEAIEVLRTWFGDCSVEEACLDSGTFSDCHRIAYRFVGRRPAGPFVIEQQVYFNQSDGQITWMRLLCSGFRTP